MIETFSLTSPAFVHNGRIPAKYTCDGERFLSPPLTIRGVPEGTQALAFVMDDLDVPKQLIPGGVFDHWVVYNIPADTTEIAEGATVGMQGVNSRDKEGYTGPCPPPEYEPSEHRYIFTLYALSSALSLPESPTKAQVLEAIAPVLVSKAELVGRYSRK